MLKKTTYGRTSKLKKKMNYVLCPQNVKSTLKIFTKQSWWPAMPCGVCVCVCVCVRA